MEIIHRTSQGGPLRSESFDLSGPGSQVCGEPSISDELDARLRKEIIEGFGELQSLRVTTTGLPTVGLETECSFIRPDGSPFDELEEMIGALKARNVPITWEYAPHIAEATSPVTVAGGTFLRQLEEQVRSLPEIVQAVLQLNQEQIAACMTGMLPSYGVEEVTRGRICSKHSRYKHLFAGLNHITSQYPFGRADRRETHSVLANGLNTSGELEQTEIVLTPCSIRVEGPNYCKVVRAPEGQIFNQTQFGAMTSFQLHLGVDNAAQKYVKLHRLGQLLTAPLAAIAANSLFVYGRPLLQISRFGVFREITHPQRYNVNGWLSSPLEQFRHHIGFEDPLVRPLIDPSVGSKTKLESITPLQKLFTHSGTFWPHVRTVATVIDGVLDLRTEFRPLCTASTAIDNAAHAALYYGTVAGLDDLLRESYGLEIGGSISDLEKRLSYRQVAANDVNAAAYGVRAMINWVDGVSMPLVDFYRSVLVPAMERGFKKLQIDETSAQRYRRVLDDRLNFQLPDCTPGISGSDIQLWLYNNHPELKECSGPEKLRKLSIMLADAARQDTRDNPQPLLNWFVRNHLVS